LDDFDRPALAPQWNFVRNPAEGDVSLSARPGFLRVNGSAVSLSDAASPAAIVRRQQHFRVRCSTALEFAPRESNEEAGLTVRARAAFHYDLAVRRGAGATGREAVLTSHIAGAPTVVGRAPLGAGVVTLEVVAAEASYTFNVAVGKARSQRVGTLP